MILLLLIALSPWVPSLPFFIVIVSELAGTAQVELTGKVRLPSFAELCDSFPLFARHLRLLMLFKLKFQKFS